MTANILNNFIQGTGPTVALSPTSVNFGNHIVGATEHSAGGDPLEQWFSQR